MDLEREPRRIDVDTWARREAFELFRSFGFPYLSLTATVNISRLRRNLRREAISFTVGWVHLLAKAANAVPAFRQRMRGNQVVEHAAVHPSVTILTDDEGFSFCNLPYDEDLRIFANRAAERIEAARSSPSLFVEPDRDDLLFLTAIPWVSFSGFIHPGPLDPPDSIPRIAWGRFREDADRVDLPLNVQVHHALVDGIHVGRFFENVESLIEAVGGGQRD